MSVIYKQIGNIEHYNSGKIIVTTVVVNNVEGLYLLAGACKDLAQAFWEVSENGVDYYAIAFVTGPTNSNILPIKIRAKYVRINMTTSTDCDFVIDRIL